MALLKRKIEGKWHFMPSGTHAEYALCGLAYDGEDYTDAESLKPEVPLTSRREINCPDCRRLIDAVKDLLKMK